MAPTLLSTTFSNANAAREINIIKHLTSDGVISGMAPFVAGADAGNFTLSLSSGEFIVGSTIMEDDTEYTSLWDLTAYAASSSGTPGVGVQFLFYIEYEYDRTTPVGPNYRFLYQDTNLTLTLAHRGNALNDPNHADTGHENSFAIPLARLIIPDGASSIDDADVVIIREPLLASRQALTNILLNQKLTIEYEALGASYNYGEDPVIRWKNLMVSGISSHPELTNVRGPNAQINYIVDGSLETVSGPEGISYTKKLEIPSPSFIGGGGIFYIHPDWSDYSDTCTLKYVNLGASNWSDLVGANNGWSGSDEYPYRADLENAIIIGIVSDDTSRFDGYYNISWLDGSQSFIRNDYNGTGADDIESHIFHGRSNAYVSKLVADVYGTEIRPDIDGKIELEDVITNLSQLQDMGLQEVYDSLETGSPDGAGRDIDLGGGAMELTNHAPVSPTDQWDAAVRVILSSDTNRPNSERALDIVATMIDDAPPVPVLESGEFFGRSTRAALTYKIPLTYIDGVVASLTSSPRSVTIREHTTEATYVEIVDPTIHDTIEKIIEEKDRKVYATFTLTAPNENAEATTTYFELRLGKDIGADDTLYLVQQDEDVQATLSQFGGLVSPITSQTMTLWEEVIRLESTLSRFNTLKVNDVLGVREIQGLDGVAHLTVVASSTALANTESASSTSVRYDSHSPIDGDGVAHLFRVKDRSGTLPSEELLLGAVEAVINRGSSEEGALFLSASRAGSTSRQLKVVNQGGIKEVLIDDNPDSFVRPYSSQSASLSVLSDKNPRLNIGTREQSNSDGARDSYFDWTANKADGTGFIQAQILSAHDGASDDYKTEMQFKVANASGVLSKFLTGYTNATQNAVLGASRIGNEGNTVTFEDELFAANARVSSFKVDAVSPASGSSIVVVSDDTFFSGNLRVGGSIRGFSNGDTVTFEDPTLFNGNVTTNARLSSRKISTGLSYPGWVVGMVARGQLTWSGAAWVYGADTWGFDVSIDPAVESDDTIVLEVDTSLTNSLTGDHRVEVYPILPLELGVDAVSVMRRWERVATFADLGKVMVRLYESANTGSTWTQATWNFNIIIWGELEDSGPSPLP